MAKFFILITGLYSIILVIAITFISKGIKQINNECIEEECELAEKLRRREMFVKSLQHTIAELKSKQFYGNVNIPLNVIEDAIKNELSHWEKR